MSTTETELPIVFVVTHGRSGSTLLQTILDAHPNTIAPVESRFVVHFKNKYGKRTTWKPEHKKSFVEDLFTEQKIELFWEIDREKLEQILEDLPEKTNYASVCRAVYASSISGFAKKEPRVIIDKNPIYALLIPDLLEVFPDARFIHLVRDYRGCASSVLSIVPNESVRMLGQHWLLYNMEIEKVKEGRENRFYLLRYENFLTNPEKEIKAVTAFLGIDFEPEMLCYHEKIEALVHAYIERSPTERVRKYRELGTSTVHKNISRKIQPNFLNKWRERLTPEQQNVLHTTCAAFAQRYEDGVIASNRLSLAAKFFRFKIRLYYSLPIWLRELKNKPSLGLLKVNENELNG